MSFVLYDRLYCPWYPKIYRHLLPGPSKLCNMRCPSLCEANTPMMCTTWRHSGEQSIIQDGGHWVVVAAGWIRKWYRQDRDNSPEQQQQDRRSTLSIGMRHFRPTWFTLALIKSSTYLNNTKNVTLIDRPYDWQRDMSFCWKSLIFLVLRTISLFCKLLIIT